MTEETTPKETPAVTVAQADYEKALSQKQALEAEAVHYKKELERFKGIDPEEHAAMKDSLKTYERNAADDPEEKEAIIKRQLEEQFAEKIAALETANKSISGENHELKVVDKAVNKIGDLFNSDTLPFIKQIVRKAVDVNEQGDFTIKDEQGNVRLNGSAKPMSLEEYGQELAEQYPSMAKAKTTAGGKQPGQKISGNGISNALPSGFHGWSPQDKTEWFEANPGYILTDLPLR